MQPKSTKFEGGRATAVIALGALVVASFSLQQPFAGVLLVLVLALLAVAVALAVFAALSKQGRRRRSLRNTAAASFDAGPVATYGAWDNVADDGSAPEHAVLDRVDPHASRNPFGA